MNLNRAGFFRDLLLLNLSSKAWLQDPTNAELGDDDLTECRAQIGLQSFLTSYPAPAYELIRLYSKTSPRGSRLHSYVRQERSPGGSRVGPIVRWHIKIPFWFIHSANNFYTKEKLPGRSDPGKMSKKVRLMPCLLS